MLADTSHVNCRRLSSKPHHGCNPVPRRYRDALRCTALDVSHERPVGKVKVKAGPKLRLDELCVQQHPELSRNLLQSWILQGKVLVDGRVVTKSGQQVSRNVRLELQAVEPRFVGRGGFKLEAALLHWGITLAGKVALDSGQSTGGFSDCLLQHGAAKVIGVDVGYGQLHHKVRSDERVVVLERTNLRYLRPSDLPCKVDFVTLDLAFISVLKVLPAVLGVLQPAAELVVLIKPHFEARRSQVSSGGVVRDPKVHQEVITRIISGFEAAGFRNEGHITSPLVGDKGGNVEFLAYFVRDAASAASAAASVSALCLDVSSSSESDDDDDGDDGGDDDDGGGRDVSSTATGDVGSCASSSTAGSDDRADVGPATAAAVDEGSNTASNSAEGGHGTRAMSVVAGGDDMADAPGSTAGGDDVAGAASRPPADDASLGTPGIAAGGHIGVVQACMDSQQAGREGRRRSDGDRTAI